MPPAKKASPDTKAQAGKDSSPPVPPKPVAVDKVKVPTAKAGQDSNRGKKSGGGTDRSNKKSSAAPKGGASPDKKKGGKLDKVDEEPAAPPTLMMGAPKPAPS